MLQLPETLPDAICVKTLPGWRTLNGMFPWMSSSGSAHTLRRSGSTYLDDKEAVINDVYVMSYLQIISYLACTCE